MGFEVLVMRPFGGVPYLDGELPLEGDVSSCVKQAKPDIVFVEQWALLEHLDRIGKIPIICDLHGSLLWENWYKNCYSPMQMRSKIMALSKADAFVVPGMRQYYYFLGWAMMAGLPCDENRVFQIPLVLDPSPYDDALSTPEKRIVMGGADWPWVEVEIKEKILLYLKEQGYELMSFNHKPMERDLEGQKSSFTGKCHKDLIPYYLQSAGAFDFYKLNRERELAITTRTVEYLYCGLPVIYPEGLELSSVIGEKGLGIVLNQMEDLLHVDDLARVLETSRKNLGQIRVDLFPQMLNMGYLKETIEQLIPVEREGISAVYTMESRIRQLTRRCGFLMEQCRRMQDFWRKELENFREEDGE
jgi:hypothetical protein